MAFKKQGADLNQSIKVIKDEKKVTACMEEKILCPHCKQVIGTKLGETYQVLDKRLISLKGTICPKCNKELK